MVVGAIVKAAGGAQKVAGFSREPSRAQRREQANVLDAGAIAAAATPALAQPGEDDFAIGWPYRRGQDLVEFFNHYGFRDVYESGFPTRALFAKERLGQLAPKPAMASLLCDLVDPRHWFDLTQPTLQTNEACAAKVLICTGN
ncbi:hypothetical protein YK56LOC_68980 [Caballeronia sp. HLA56]